MEIYISINGVLRNFIQKFEYMYDKEFINSEPQNIDDNFEYRIKYPIQNNKLSDSFIFQNDSEFDNFTYIDYALELFGHSSISSMATVNELNTLIYKYPKHNFTLIGVDEFGKAKPSTLFFLSKYGFLLNNIKFILSKDINDEWKKCDIWITDDQKIIGKCPKNKMAIKFNTQYNQHFPYGHEINNISKIEELCLKSWENTITSMSMRLLKFVARITDLKGLMKRKNQKDKMVNLY